MMLLLRRLVLVLRVHAVGLWLFGWVVLGAIVAPIQFKIVPSPYAAEAMTRIFRRFDTIALACAAVVWLTDILLGNSGESRLRILKRALAGIATIALVVEAMVIAPHIDELFHAGAIRGVGPDGESLQAWHRAAESAGKLQVLTLLLLMASELYDLVVTRAASAVAGPGAAPNAGAVASPVLSPGASPVLSAPASPGASPGPAKRDLPEGPK